MAQRLKPIETVEVPVVVEPDYFRKQHSGSKFMKVLVELIKNSRDRQAAMMWLVSNLAFDLFRIVDNGIGLNVATPSGVLTKRSRMSRFFSLGRSEEDDEESERQLNFSGKFGTGVKDFAISTATDVTIVTVSVEEPDTVYRVTVTIEEWMRYLSAQGSIHPERHPKTPETWPYDFPTGTELTFTLANPKSGHIRRGTALAEEVAARFPWDYRHFIRVDGEMIPQREFIGKPFKIEIPHKVLGTVRFELYHPRQKATEDQLRFGATEVGEVPLHNFAEAVGDLAADIPLVYRMGPDVCSGGIFADFLNDFAQEDRQTFAASLADDPRTELLIRLMEQYAQSVQDHLQIKVRTGDLSASDRVEIDDFTDALNKQYNPDGKKPVIDIETTNTDSDGEDVVITNGDDQTRPLFITCQRPEYEPGELIEITLKLRDDIAAKIKNPNRDIHYYFDESRAKVTTKGANGARLVAHELGEGRVVVDIPCARVKGSVRYVVVKERKFRLAQNALKTKRGTELPLITVNHDKLVGGVGWAIERGHGELKRTGHHAVFRATRASLTVVRAFDNGNPRISDTVEITVVRGDEWTPIWIRGVCFMRELVEVDDETYSRPVTMNYESPEGPHRLVINIRAPGYKEAREAGVLRPFLYRAAAREFARFANFEIEKFKPSEFDPRETPAFVAKLAKIEDEIFAEMMRAA